MKDIVNPLNDPEMKAVRGGYYGGSGDYPPYDGSGSGLRPGTCGFGVRLTMYTNGSHEGEMGGCNMDKASAQYLAAKWGGNWCCDSCYSTWYCGDG